MQSIKQITFMILNILVRVGFRIPGREYDDKSYKMRQNCELCLKPLHNER